MTLKDLIKNSSDKISFSYLKNVKKWMYCPSCNDGKLTINKNKTLWECKNCGYELTTTEFENGYVFWFCDKCNAYLNSQEGFDKCADKHLCKVCGYENNITFYNIKGMCKDCGLLLSNPDATLCEECKIERLKKAGKVLLAVGAFVGVVASAINSQDSASDTGVSSTSYGFNDDLECANCGNTNSDTLWNEGDTIYCSLCCHRTSKESGEDDVVECPYCHRMRDRKAMYCRYCNDSTWESSTEEEYEETDKILKDMGC